jgi:BolA protein
MSGDLRGKPVEHAIRKKLVETLNPVHLDIFNESHMHNVPPGSETHFKVVVVSDKFNNLPLIKV